ncbi:DUF4440 domain-containing protein [Halogeometricum borinquense]|uniref:DUF4440 domain-containing protein n=1 Tax=Halogeometricum borinquense TaxID=60847 RepID=A0A482TCX3_9EURY|nr:DUF4440 domain-containing protein [Halogeometricum borinquense]RYJ14136.1 DUF4440 domain-containing protein [Halogeometricum borinquense]
MSLAEACEREIVGLHDFFERWFRGEAPETDESFARVADALGPAFEMVTPDGEVRKRDPLLDSIRDGHGHAPGLSIDVSDVAVRHEDGDTCVLTYREHQTAPEEATTRVSSVVFVRDSAVTEQRSAGHRAESGDPPEGVRWHHLHETWVPK